MPSTKYRSGIHVGEIVDFSIGTSRVKGTKSIKFVLDVIGEVDQSDPSNIMSVESGNAYIDLWLTPGSIEITRQQIDRLCTIVGIPNRFSSFRDFVNGATGPFADLVGAQVEMKNENESGYDNWKFWVNRPAANEVAPDEIAELDNLFGAVMKDGVRADEAYSAPETQPEPSESTEEIPF